MPNETVHKILLTGATGMLGKELNAYLSSKGFEILTPDSTALNLLETLESLQEKIEAQQPDLILHTAALTNVDDAELHPDLAMAINKDGTRKLALVTRQLKCPLAMISTDYVFDGTLKRPYEPSDRPNPINTYGLSKLYGELMLTELLEKYYIIRTSWLYGIHGKNFVQFVLEAARHGREISIVNDQTGSPTWTGSLCPQIESIITSGEFGTYHAADEGHITRFEQAQAICELAGLSPDHIQAIPSKDFQQPAKRPAFSALACEKTAPPHWKDSLQKFIQQYLHQAKA